MFSSIEAAMADISSTPNQLRWNALREIVERLPAQLARYGSALGAIVLAGAGQLPPGLEFVAGSLGGNMLSNMISDILNGKDLADDEIRLLAEEAIRKSDIVNLLTKEDFMRLYTEFRQRLDIQEAINLNILDEVRMGFSKIEELLENEYPLHDIPQKTSIFISYARKDGITLTKQLHAALSEKGFEVWFDQESMRSRGSGFPAELKRGIEDADYVIFISTPSALQSEWVMQLELECALSTCRAIIPIVYKGGYDILPPALTMRHAINFEGCDTNPSIFKDRLRELVDRNLSYPPDKLAEDNFGDSLLPFYLDRPEDKHGIKETFLADEGLGRKPRVYKDGKKIIGLHGMGGVGKTTLAIALARDCDVRRAFVDGIYWVTLGDINQANEEVRLTQAQAQLIMQLTTERKTWSVGIPPPPRSVLDGSIRLKGLLQNKKCLIIIDDVWHADDARVFGDVLGEHCRMVVTTRKQPVLRALDTLEYEIVTLGDKAALELLARVSHPKRLPSEAEATEIVHLCGGLPFALAIIGASVRDSVGTWDHYRESLRKGDVTTVVDQEKSLHIVFNVSIEEMRQGSGRGSRQIADQLFDLAIFQNNQLLPVQAIERLWRSRYQSHDVLRILDFLKDRSLLQRQEDTFVVHGLLLSFLRQQLGEQLPERHSALLDAYNEHNVPWHKVKDDGYLYDHLVYHLEAADKIEDIHKLFENRCWSEQRRSAVGLLSDFERAKQLAAPDINLSLRYGIFRAGINETYRQIPVTALSMLLQSRITPIETLIRTAQEMQGSEVEKLKNLLELVESPGLTEAQKEACADAITAVIQTWDNWTYRASSCIYEKEELATVVHLIERAIRAVQPYPAHFRVIRRVLWKQAFSLDDEPTRSRFFSQLFDPPLSEQERAEFVRDVMEKKYEYGV
jgi:hypothetical protein